MNMVDPQEAFEYAIEQGLTNPEDYMYMHSTENSHAFKHIDTREYLLFSWNEVKE